MFELLMLEEQCKFCEQTKSNKITDVFLVLKNRNKFKIAETYLFLFFIYLFIYFFFIIIYICQYDTQELAVTNKIALYDIHAGTNKIVLN